MHRVEKLMETDDGPGQMYEEIKKRLMKFLEAPTERQLHVKTAWNELTKTNDMTALQFEAAWEKASADLDDEGSSNLSWKSSWHIL